MTQAIFPRITDPARINTGKCYIWAYSAFLIFKDVELCDVNCHAFVRYRGKFYDSETPNGVMDWRELPATARWRVKAATYSATKFKLLWRSNLRKHHTSWKRIESNARKVLRRAQTSV